MSEGEPSSSSIVVGEPRPTSIGHDLRMAAIVVALALAFAFLPRALRGWSNAAATSGEDAPAFAGAVVANAELPAQKTLSLADLKGRPVILDFWATWCGPCQAEMPIVNNLAQRYKDKGLVVVGVNTSDEPGLAERLVLRKGFTFPIVYDQNNLIARDYRVENLPTLVVISKTGKVFATRHGITSDADLERLVKQVL